MMTGFIACIVALHDVKFYVGQILGNCSAFEVCLYSCFAFNLVMYMNKSCLQQEKSKRTLHSRFVVNLIIRRHPL